MKKRTRFVIVGAVGFTFVSGFLAKDILTTPSFAQPALGQPAPEAPPTKTKTAPVKGMENAPIKQRQEIGHYQMALSSDKLYLLDTTNGRCWVRETKPANNVNANNTNLNADSWIEISPPWATGVIS